MHSAMVLLLGFGLTAAGWFALTSVPAATEEGTVRVVAPAMDEGADAAGADLAADRAFEVEAALGRGHSGALRTHLVMPGERVTLATAPRGAPAGTLRYRWTPVLGSERAATTPPAAFGAGADGPNGGRDAAESGNPWPANAVLTAPRTAGIYELEVTGSGGRFRVEDVRLVVLAPLDRKRNGRIDDYRIGRYPRGHRDPNYAPPTGLIEVTPQNRRLRLSDNFRVEQFLTKDQHNVWPKYVAIDIRLIDKLELVLQELNAMGMRAERMHVMSGYRTPQYNALGVGAGRAQFSRHQYGDAADVWVDNEDNGYISDLNGDGRRDVRDVRVMLRAVDRVESRFPDLVGGAGVYNARPGVRGPFLHIDVRGRRARW